MREAENGEQRLARRFAVGVAASLAGIVWSHALAAVLRGLGPDGAPLAPAALTVSAVTLALFAALLPRRTRPADAALAGAGGGLAAALAVEAWAPGSWAGALALPVVFAAVAPAAGWLGRRLPARLGGTPGRGRAAAAVWVLAAVVGVAQVARLATYMTDTSVGFALAPENPFWYGHECLNAYVHGAELHERGEPNVYDARHYPALDREAEPVTRFDGMRVEDPYQYPPQFLLLPSLALRLTDDYPTLRVVWFGIQLSFFAGVYALLALWVGGRAGRYALLALPGLLGAFPFLHNFQFGQFHLAAVALAAAGMLAFATRRRALGGALLAVAILAKMFPAVLLMPLAARRRFRDLSWTAAWGIAITALALAVLGPAPFVAFFDYHLPRLGSGEAFAFDEAWPELTDLVVADNQGAFGLATKLGFAKPVAAAFSRGFTVAVLALAAFLAARHRDPSRWGRAALWLALLGLASMASPGAWGDYTPVTGLWLAALLLAGAAADRRWTVPLAVAGVFQYFLVGTMPIGEWAPPDVMIPVATVGLLSLLGLYLAGALAHARLVEGREQAPAERPARERIARAA